MTPHRDEVDCAPESVVSQRQTQTEDESPADSAPPSSAEPCEERAEEEETNGNDRHAERPPTPRFGVGIGPNEGALDEQPEGAIQGETLGEPTPGCGRWI